MPSSASATQIRYPGPTDADLAAMPDALKRLDQWVLWQLLETPDAHGELKLVKVPKNPRTLNGASTTNPKTWGTYQACVSALPKALATWTQTPPTEYDGKPATYHGAGVGFVFTADDPYMLVDLDHSRDPTTGTVADWALTIIDTLQSYTQRSVSGEGVHVLVQARVPTEDKQHGEVQTWDQGRFCAMTGWHLPGTPTTIEPRHSQLIMVHATHILLPKTQKAQQQAPQQSRVAKSPKGTPPALSDTAILEKIRQAQNSAKFARLWNGDTTGYPSGSEADLALLALLAFYTQDAAQLDSLFRQSALAGARWPRKHYRDKTMAKALAGVTEHYDPETYKATQTALKRQRTPEATRRRNGTTPEGALLPETDPTDTAKQEVWTDQLNRTKGGEAKETFNNLAIALEHLPPWDTQSWFDLVRDRAMVDTSPVDEQAVWRAAQAIEAQTAMPIRNLKLVMSALRSRCHHHPRDLLQEWLKALPPWDETPRLTEWLYDAADVPKTAYTMAVARLWPVSMVARALHPGIQCRSVIIVEGEQDIGKSKLIKTLTGADWYREVSGTLEGKEAHMLMKGAWVVELSEMDVLLRTEESRVKSFITMCNDEYVPKYANDPVKLARRTILMGTINPEGDGSYLRDQTGATRYYPLSVRRIALADVEACRDQLFAEALVWFNDHPADWWQMPEAAADELRDMREARRKEAVFEGPRLREWLAEVRAGATKVTPPFHTEDALRYCFQIPPERWTPAIKDQMGKAISKCGWANKPKRVDGHLQRRWHYGGVTPDEKV